MGAKVTKEEDLERIRNEFIMSKEPLAEILENARTGIYDYKFKKLQKIAEGGQGLVSKI